MSERETRLRDAFAAYNGGDFEQVEQLFVEDARWHGIEGVGDGGETPV